MCFVFFLLVLEYIWSFVYRTDFAVGPQLQQTVNSSNDKRDTNTGTNGQMEPHWIIIKRQSLDMSMFSHIIFIDMTVCMLQRKKKNTCSFPPNKENMTFICTAELYHVSELHACTTSLMLNLLFVFSRLRYLDPSRYAYSTLSPCKE